MTLQNLISKEREACAKIADGLAEGMKKEIAAYPGLDHEASSASLMAATWIAAQIRKRNKMTLLECIKEMDLTPDEFAHAISVPPATIAALIRGDDVPAPKVMLVRQTLLEEGLYWDGK